MIKRLARLIGDGKRGEWLAGKKTNEQNPYFFGYELRELLSTFNYTKMILLFNNTLKPFLGNDKMVNEFNAD